MSNLQALDTVRALLAANVPMVLESLPGQGKTSLVGALFESSGGYLEVMSASQHDATDFGGMPAPNLAAGRYSLLAGDWAHELVEAVESGAHPIVGVFLDETNTATRITLAALLKVVDERRVGRLALPRSVRMVLAINPAAANGGADFTSAMANRIAHVPFKYPLRSWADDLENVDGATGHFALPAPLIIPPDDEIITAGAEFRRAVAEYARTNPSAFDDSAYPDDPIRQSGAFPSRRSWTLATRAVGAARALQLGRRTEAAVVASLIGSDEADEFLSWAATADLESPSDILADPNGWDIPTRDDLLIKSLENVTEYAADCLGADNGPAMIEAAAIIYGRVISEGSKPTIAAASVGVFAEAIRDYVGDDKVTRAKYMTPPVVSALKGYSGILKNVRGLGDVFGSEA